MGSKNFSFIDKKYLSTYYLNNKNDIYHRHILWLQYHVPAIADIIVIGFPSTATKKSPTCSDKCIKL